MKYNPDYDVDALDQFTEVASALGYHVSVFQPIRYNLGDNTAAFNADFFLFEGLDAETAIAKHKLDMPPDDWDSLCAIAASLTRACKAAAGISRTMCDSFSLRCTISCGRSISSIEAGAQSVLGNYLQHPSVRCIAMAMRVSKDFYDTVFKVEDLDAELADAVMRICNDFDAAVIQGADDLCQWFLSRLHYEEMYAPAEEAEDYYGKQA